MSKPYTFFFDFLFFLFQEFSALALSEGIVIFDGREVVGQDWLVVGKVFIVKM